MKKGKLSKLEIRFIETSKLTKEEIAAELERPLETVEKYLEQAENKKTVKEKVAKTFGVKKQGKSSVVVSHEGASQRGDASHDKSKGKKVQGNTDCIHFI